MNTHSGFSRREFLKGLGATGLVVTAGGLIQFISACDKAEPGTKTPVKVVMDNYFGSWFNTYAIRNGLVTSNSVDVTVDLSLSFDNQMMAGNYPIGVMSTTAFAIAADQGNVGFTAMCAYLADKGTAAAKGVDIVYTKAGSPLKSPSDLKGKKVGVPGLQSGAASLFLGMLKDEYGIDQSQMTLVDSPVPQLITLLANGSLDASLLNGDPSVQTYYNSAYQVLWNVDQAFQQQYGTYAMSTFLVVQSDYLKNSRDTAKAVYDLLKESSAYGQAHIADLAAQYVSLNGGSADELQNACLNHYSVTFDNLTGKIADAATTIFGFVEDRGIISKLPDPSLVFMQW